MFSLYKKELQSYFLSPIAYFVIAFFMATFSLTFIQEIGNVSSSTYTFSFSSIFYVNIFYFIFLLPLLTMRTFSEERKNGTETMLLSSPLNVTQIVIAKFLATATILLIMLAAAAANRTLGGTADWEATFDIPVLAEIPERDA